MECQEAMLKLAALVDDRGLPGAELEAHLADCAACCEAREQLARLEEQLGAWGARFEPSAEFDARLLARIEGEKASLRRARAFRESTGVDTAVVRAGLRRQAWRASVRVLLDGTAWAAVACVVAYAAIAAAGSHPLPGPAIVAAAFAAVAVGGTLGLATRRGQGWLARWMGRLIS